MIIMGKKINKVWNIICYSLAICSVGYLIIFSIPQNGFLKYNNIIYIIFAIALLIQNKKIKFNILRIICILSFVNIILHNFLYGWTELIFYTTYVITGMLFSQEYTCDVCGKRYGWKILFCNKCPHCGNIVK